MRFGEKMSEWVVFESLVWSSNGDVYENSVNAILDKPIDSARLFYVKLVTALGEDAEVEVWWNHIANRIAIDVETTAGRKFETEFEPQQMARTDLVQRVDQFVDMVKGIVHGFDK
jgi:hypothetical protein